ncbi:MAG: hypothetical protein NVS3B17_03970 [Vulcanimicrobiaceae bacterium]
MRRGTGDSLSGWLALAAPLGLYLATLSPGVDFWDIGEMQTVPYLLGIAHPTGFPLVVLVGWLFTHAVPLGDPAWRMSLLCAIATSVAAHALYVFVCDVTADARVAVASALAFAVGSDVWRHAIRADVHDVALATIAITLSAAARAGARRDARALAVAAFAAGCGLAVHPVVALALPCAVAFAWPAIAAGRARERRAAIALACVPLAAYAYVPLRSGYIEAHDGDPGRALGLAGTAIFDSGAPSSPEAFLRYVRGDEFVPLHAFARAATPDGMGRTLAFARDVAYHNDGYLMLALALVGFGVVARRTPRLAVGFALLVVGTLAFVANYVAESDAARYGLGSLWVMGACAGIGAWWLARALAGDARARPHASLLATLALAVALVPSVAVAAANVGRDERLDDARELGPNVARLTVDGSLVVASWNFAMPLAYETYVARSLGTRRLACGWPHDFVGRYPAWRVRYRHVYFVLARAYDVAPFARPIVAVGRWQLSELRS